ncbi:hypothetical protein [Teredinibacter sp. KSP-S5-2]|uniref:hypothetical protein n=1 Tax=Teredinibacter sp. KSP-S5-2 TaxID=3034506 RepID=UPI002934852D|nr:hypothetical protein [Teredinibacter sp. KSP-S5-2]WNO11178.1 hypothetical protein P5V12_08330 [Teredinibacter sp. KSP-S5-2]
MDYKEVENYLRDYGADVGVYDFNGLIHLVAAALDNLERGHLEQDLVDCSSSLSEDNIKFLKKLIRYHEQCSDDS